MITYRRGESGKPCLSPLEALKKGVGLPFKREAIQGDAMQVSVHDIKS
jgi:hypothetical protein